MVASVLQEYSKALSLLVTFKCRYLLISSWDRCPDMFHWDQVEQVFNNQLIHDDNDTIKEHQSSQYHIRISWAWLSYSTVFLVKMKFAILTLTLITCVVLASAHPWQHKNHQLQKMGKPPGIHIHYSLVSRHCLSYHVYQFMFSSTHVESSFTS